MFVVRLAFRPWRLAPWSQLFSAVAVGGLLVMAGFLFWMDRGLKPVLQRLQSEQVVTAYLSSSVEPKDEEKIADSIRLSLGSAATAAGSEAEGHRSVEVALVDASGFLQKLRGTYAELVKELEDLGPDENSAIIPRYVSISGFLPANALERIRGIPGIEAAESSKDRYKNVIGAFSVLRWVSRLLFFGLMASLFAGLIHLTRMNSFFHRDATALMRLWGAGEWTTRLPGLISGAFVGFLGGLMAIGGWLFLAVRLGDRVRLLSPVLRDMPVPSAELALLLGMGGIFLGMIAGIFGARSA